MNPFTRFWSQVDTSGECWIWKGRLYQNGYGDFMVKKQHYSAHRFSYELLIAPVPIGLELDHLCRNRVCVRPLHLEPVTREENLARGINRRREYTHCPQGHPYSGDNLYINPASNGRVCRTCQHKKKGERIRVLSNEERANGNYPTSMTYIRRDKPEVVLLADEVLQ